MVHSDSSTDLTSLRVNLSECSSASLDMSSDLDITLAIGSPLLRRNAGSVSAAEKIESSELLTASFGAWTVRDKSRAVKQKRSQFHGNSRGRRAQKGRRELRGAMTGIEADADLRLQSSRVAELAG